MLFTLLVAGIIAAAVIGGFLAYYTSDSYDAASNSGGTVVMTLLIGGFLLFMIMMAASSAAKDDPKNHVVKSEKTYTIAENSIPTVNGAEGELSFSYIENGQVFPFTKHVDPFTIGFEKPKAFKITEYDVIDKGIASWPVNGGTKVEIIK